eukprot:5940164-Amphidinium_carterae.1
MQLFALRTHHSEAPAPKGSGNFGSQSLISCPYLYTQSTTDKCMRFGGADEDAEADVGVTCA